MKNVILVNGPPGSGKDTLAEFLQTIGWVNHVRFKDELYKEASRISGIPVDFLVNLATDRKAKERPNPNFMVGATPLSPREYLIHVSETVIKPLKGADYFGVCTAEKLGKYTVISDSGFVEEFRPVADRATKLLVVKLKRKGCSFENDSRDYLPEHLIKAYRGTTLELANNFDTILELENAFAKELMEIKWI